MKTAQEDNSMRVILLVQNFSYYLIMHHQPCQCLYRYYYVRMCTNTSDCIFAATTGNCRDEYNVLYPGILAVKKLITIKCLNFTVE